MDEARRRYLLMRSLGLRLPWRPDKASMIQLSSLGIRESFVSKSVSFAVNFVFLAGQAARSLGGYTLAEEPRM